MRIDSLKTNPDRAGRYWVTFSDGSKLALYRQSVEDFGLYAGKELSDDELTALKENAGKVSARMRAVRIVSATSVSKKDLESRLIQKGENPGQAKQAVAWLEDLNLVDDRRTAESVVYSCIAKGYGLQRAKQALFEKKIPKEFWDEVLTDYPDQMEKILSFLRSRLSDPSDQKQIKKAVDALLRRGHSYGAVREALQQLTMEFDEFPED